MRRLTYAPKAWVFVRSRNHGGKVFDISDYCVSGSVQRLVNQPSKATIEIRNSFFQFSPPGKFGFFLPMDGITIWLQRLKNRPIQVFTGYLDSVPYYQMYPGNCRITATCTLKRLQHVYFDPGVQAMRDLFNANGWSASPDGTAFNLNTNAGASESNNSNDAGIGKIIAPFLTEVCGWPSDQIHISNLPPDLPKKAHNLYGKIAAEQLSMADGLESVLKNMMTVQAGTNKTTVNPIKLDIVGTIKDAASTANMPPLVMITAAMALSGLDPSLIGSDGSLGLYATPNKSMKENVYGDNSSPFFTTSPLSDRGRMDYDGKTYDQIVDPQIATAAFAVRLAKADPDNALRKAANKGDVSAIAEWIAKANHINKQQIAIAVVKSYPNAKKFLAAFGEGKDGLNQPVLSGKSVDVLPQGLTWDSGSLWDHTNFNELGGKSTLTGSKFTSDKDIVGYKNANESLAPYVFVAHKSGLVLTDRPASLASRTDIVVFKDPTPDHKGTSKAKQFFDWAKTQGGADIVHYAPKVKSVVFDKSGTASTVTDVTDVEYRRGIQVVAAEQEDWPDGLVFVQVPKVAPYPLWTGNPATSTNQSNANPSGSADTPATPDYKKNLTFEDIATIALQTAFYASSSFPADATTSNVLTGDKALMNDIPVMTGVAQFCQGSMRSFMSLPDGSFCAFYPDYFGGSKRKCYWAISDLETVNMGIQLSDEALATHVYVTGALFTPNSITSMVDAVTTPGVVTLAHVFGDGGFIATDIQGNTAGDILARTGEAFQFLQFYGARPYSLEKPLIRSTYFEFLYAWQLFMWMWAMQFQTTAEFTFQPEVMAGGRIAFPDHDLEMYVENVTHSWSYESGFTTTATLTAPASTQKDPHGKNFFPGFALAGSGLSGLGGIG